MHVLGKVFMAFVILFAIGAVMLSVKMLDTRNAWGQALDKQQKDVLAAQQTLAGLRADRQKTLEELQRVQLGWGEEWPGVEIQVQDPNQGLILLPRIGRNNEIASRTPQNVNPVYGLFYVNNQNISRFLGTFEVGGVQPNSAVLRYLPTPPFTNNPQGYAWNPLLTSADWAALQGQGGGFRLREYIPSSYVTRYNELQTSLRFGYDRYLNQQQKAAAELQLLTAAKLNRDIRISELLGHNYLPAEQQLKQDEQQRLPELTKGFLAAIEDEDASRNAVLAEVDELRRQVKAAKDKIARLQAENDKLSNELPQPAVE